MRPTESNVPRSFQFHTDSSEPPFQTREEYTEKLNKWLNEARLWHTFCAGFPFYMTLQNQNAANQTNLSNFWNNIFNQRPTPLLRPVRTSAAFQPDRVYEFRIPPIWKRLAAEFVDFLILIFIKMIVTFILTESFYVVSLENYKFETFKKNLSDPKIAMKMSMEILTLEFLHRFIVCFYEVYWLKGSMCATPGKRYMGIIVVRVNTVIAVPGSNETLVRCTGVRPLTLKKAIIRAVLKNVLLGIMLPICFALYVFRFNRTGYDAISKCLVVEYNPNLPQRPVQ